MHLRRRDVPTREDPRPSGVIVYIGLGTIVLIIVIVLIIRALR